MTEAEKTGVDNPYRYSTKEWDEKSGLYYFGARYYSPEIGRWTQRDPTGVVEGLNLYLYVDNGPSTLIDPWGLRRYIPNYSQRRKLAKALGLLMHSCCPQIRTLYYYLHPWVANALIDDELAVDVYARTTKPFFGFFGLQRSKLLIGEDYINDLNENNVKQMIELAGTIRHEVLHKAQFDDPIGLLRCGADSLSLIGTGVWHGFDFDTKRVYTEWRAYAVQDWVEEQLKRQYVPTK